MNLKTYEAVERAKYEKIWKQMDYTSKNQERFYMFIRPYVYGKCLEIGCGRGYIVDRLNKDGYETVGVDISLKGLAKECKGWFHQFPVWDMKFKTGAFDCSMSTDMLEHVPTELVPLAIQEIDRVTRGLTLHHIACFDDHLYFGEKVHLTVQPLDWWLEQFKGVKCKYIIRERVLWQ